MKQSISKTTVDALMAQAKEKGRTLYCFDAKVTGFGVYATKGGKASYFIHYRIGGRETPSKRLTIGKHGVITAEQARTLAKATLGRVANGVDVLDAKKTERRKLAAGTFKEVMERYLASNGHDNKSWPETRRLLEHDAIPAFGAKPMASITRGDVAVLIDETSERSRAVSRALFAQLRPLFKWAVDRGAIDVNPILGFKGPNPLSSRERTLDHEEMKAFWEATELLGWPFAPFYRLLLLTGQRREEVAGMRWEEVKVKEGVWRLPSKEEHRPQRTKNGKAHIVDLSPQAVAILKSLPGERNGLVLTTTGRTPLSGFSKVKKRLDARMSAILQNRFNRSMLPWRVHDLRRTVATLMAEDLHVFPAIIERIQNRSEGGVASIYQRQEYRAERRDALMSWGAHLDALFAPKSR